jgi:ribonuclease BN (tRNA processing enzyme)
MRLTVVGCAGSFPSPDSPASCYLVEADDGAKTWRLLLDLGSGAFGSLQRLTDPLSIDAVFLSHLHPDHCLDMCGFYVFRKYNPMGAQAAIPVWGPAGVANRLARAYDLPAVPGMRGEFSFEEYNGHPIRVGPFTVTSVPVAHPVPAYAFRVEAGGRTLAYSGDTGVCAGVEEVAAGVDLFLAEASFRACDDNPPDLHLSGKECGEIATAADANRLILTHVPAWFDTVSAVAEARSTYSGPVEAARVGAVYEI